MSDESEAPKIERAFGEESRKQLLEDYFSKAGNVTPANAWKHTYALLLWTDRTTGLAHCYESDKSQPGRPWYARSLAFHGWVASALGSTPADLSDKIDWLFKHGSEKLARGLVALQKRRAQLAAEQRADYQGFPEPGEDPSLEAAILDELKPWLSKPPPEEVMRRLVQRIHAYLSQENKRKNLVGEGFEDVLAFLIRQLPGGGKLKVSVREPLHELRGFREGPRGEKVRKVDLAIVRSRHRRTLVTAKWSVRADREEQFGVDFDTYARLEDEGRNFEYVLVTNEFDAARLAAACERRRQNADLFSSVVHVNPRGPLAAYGSEGVRGAALRLREHVTSGRLMSLEAWLKQLIASP